MYRYSKLLLWNLTSFYSFLLLEISWLVLFPVLFSMVLFRKQLQTWFIVNIYFGMLFLLKLRMVLFLFSPIPFAEILDYSMVSYPTYENGSSYIPTVLRPQGLFYTEWNVCFLNVLYFAHKIFGFATIHKPGLDNNVWLQIS